MPTNSILHDVVIEDKEAAKRLVDALEKAEAFSKKQNEPVAFHKGLKDGTIEKSHSYSLSYASKDVRELKKKVEIAELLWGERK